MSGNEIRTKYLGFMRKNGHVVVPSSPLVPENDPTTLFTGSGMQPMVPYLMGEAHPKGNRIADAQKCFRGDDIEEVGDNRHTTFFEMLGNWSFGDYFKDEQLEWFFTFLTEELSIDPKKLYVTVFSGDDTYSLPKDETSANKWEKLFEKVEVSHTVAFMGTEEEASKRGMREGERIFYYDAKKNWWSRAGIPSNMPNGEPGGPDSEVFFDFGTEHDTAFGEYCHPNCDCGRFMEIGNSVFMEYFKNEDGAFSKLPARNVDFGGGLERIVAAANNEPDMFKVDLLWNIVVYLEKISGITYADNTRAFRIISDHLRGAVFMIDDGVFPSNSDRGYFVRRLLRRCVRYADLLQIQAGQLKEVVDIVVETFKDQYGSLEKNREMIKKVIHEEEEQFRSTLTKGLREFEKLTHNGTLSGKEAFILFTSYGFPYELTEELAAKKNITIDKKEFEDEMSRHQELSRVGAEQKFKGGLADNSAVVIQYHTLTHLMLAGLKKYLGDHVHQAGSNITAERLRFDFTHPEKVSQEILSKVEDYVNSTIATGGTVTTEIMPKEVALNDPSIEGSFWEKYPDEVKVYTVTGNDQTIFSRELCGGPHVQSLREIKGTFKIIKEEATSAGVRRIKAVLT